MKILFTATEATPFIATGGLGEVIGSLSKSLASKYEGELDVRVILPLYQGIWDRRGFEFVGKTSVPLSWRQQYCGVFKKHIENVTFYLIDNEYYFNRSEPYGHFDDGEKFAFFSKSVLHILPMIDFMPDIIHASDWHTSLVPVYLSTKYHHLEGYKDIKTIITIHNIEYQGKYDMSVAEDVFDLYGKEKSIVEYNGAINLLKGALEASDLISTVSESYAEEICDDHFAHGLAQIIIKNKSKLRGILNGIDIDFYSPLNDPSLFENYSIDNIQSKYLNKINLQAMLGLPQDKTIPIIAIVSRLVKHKGLDLVARGIEEILKERVQFVILGKGDRGYELYFNSLQDIYHDKISTRIDFNTDIAKKIYAGADFLLMPSLSEPCGIAQMIASRYGTVPIVRETGGLRDSIKDCSLGVGNGFTFFEESPLALINAIRRGLAVYNNQDDWMKLVKSVMSIDFSWDKSSIKYYEMYKSLLAQGED